LSGCAKEVEKERRRPFMEVKKQHERRSKFKELVQEISVRAQGKEGEAEQSRLHSSTGKQFTIWNAHKHI
jgi:hypothetical protein